MAHFVHLHSPESSLNTQSCFKSLLVVWDFGFWVAKEVSYFWECFFIFFMDKPNKNLEFLRPPALKRWLSKNRKKRQFWLCIILFGGQNEHLLMQDCVTKLGCIVNDIGFFWDHYSAHTYKATLDTGHFFHTSLTQCLVFLGTL